MQRRANFRSPLLGIERASHWTAYQGFRTHRLRPVVGAAVVAFLLLDAFLVIALMRGDDAPTGRATLPPSSQPDTAKSSEPQGTVKAESGTQLGLPTLSDKEVGRIGETRHEPAQSASEGSASGSVSSSSSTTSGLGTSSSGDSTSGGSAGSGSGSGSDGSGSGSDGSGSGGSDSGGSGSGGSGSGDGGPGGGGP